MGRLSNRDVDDLIHDQYEEALENDAAWADEALRVREWIALDGKEVTVEFDDGAKAWGTWRWKGQTAPDFYLVYVEAPEGWVVVGSDARNFTKVTLGLPSQGQEPVTEEGGGS